MKRWLILSALLCATTATAHADPSAADLFDEGKRHFDIGDYTAAITSWKQSYLLSNAPLLLFNIGQAYRLAGNCAQANRFYLNYKRAAPAPANAAELEQAVAKCAGVEPATGEADAQPQPQPPPLVTAPPPATPPVTPPVTSAPRPPLVIDTTAGHGLRTAGLIVGGAGLALGVVAAFSGLEAAGKASDIAGQKTGTTWSPTLAAEQASGQSWQTRARVFAALGGATLVGGGIAYWLGWRAAPHVEVALGASHAAVSWSCAF